MGKTSWQEKIYAQIAACETLLTEYNDGKLD